MMNWGVIQPVAMSGERDVGGGRGSARRRRERRPFDASARTDGSRDDCGRGDAPLLTKTEVCTAIRDRHRTGVCCQSAGPDLGAPTCTGG